MSGPIGFIGLGVMGESMCRNLIRKSGRPVLVYDHVAEPVHRLQAEGAAATTSFQALASDAEVVHLSLPGGPELEQVVLGDNGLLRHMGTGQMIVDHTTAPYRLTVDLAVAANAAGVAYCDAPVARTRQAAIDGTLSIMVGGSASDFDRIKPLLDCMAADVSHCGPVGAGQVVKLLNNMILVQNVNAIAEAHAISQNLGLDPDLVFATLAKGSSDSFALRNHGKAILADDYPLLAFPTRYALKDLQYALALATDAEVDAKGGQLARDRLEEALEAGFAEEYWPVLRRII